MLAHACRVCLNVNANLTTKPAVRSLLPTIPANFNLSRKNTEISLPRNFPYPLKAAIPQYLFFIKTSFPTWIRTTIF